MSIGIKLSHHPSWWQVSLAAEPSCQHVLMYIFDDHIYMCVCVYKQLYIYDIYAYIIVFFSPQSRISESEGLYELNAARTFTFFFLILSLACGLECPFPHILQNASVDTGRVKFYILVV